ncbi:MAG: hypothetical protein AB7N71_01030 [Phycisphaerae bacterium]
MNTATALGSVVVTFGEIDASTRAISGRLGSTSGDLVNDPPPSGGLNGAHELHPVIVAGPILPGDLPTLPGTECVVTSSSDVTLEYIRTGSELAIHVTTACDTVFDNMDGGNFLAATNAFADVRFVVDVDTPFDILGDIAFDAEEISSFVQFSGGTLGNIVAEFGSAGNGPYQVFGILPPGAYRLQIFTDLFEAPPNGMNVGDFSETGEATAHLYLNPNSSLFAVGDLNCDGVLSVSDIAPFVLAITDPATYATNFPTCDIDFADANHDGIVSVSDVGAFVQLLTGHP